MKYNCSIKINKPLIEVVELWTDENNFYNWQDGFQSIKLTSGNKNEIGAVSQILIQQGKMNIELTETILVNNLPEERTAKYVHVHMTNTQTTRFVAVNDNITEYISEVEYTQFNGLALKLMAKLFPGKFKAQSEKWMVQFKVFAESK